MRVMAGLDCRNKVGDLRSQGTSRVLGAKGSFGRPYVSSPLSPYGEELAKRIVPQIDASPSDEPKVHAE